MFHSLLVCFSEVIKIWIHSKQEISSLHYANLRLTHEELQIYNSFLHLSGCNKYDFFFSFLLVHGQKNYKNNRFSEITDS